MGLTFIAFVECLFVHLNQWKAGTELEKTPQEDWFVASENHAEIRILTLETRLRSLFFKIDSRVRIVGNTIVFNSDDADYLIVDPDKKVEPR